MKTLITAAILSVASNVVSADSFAPWEQRQSITDAVSASADVNAIGFAPWRDRQTLPEMTQDSPQFSNKLDSGFRPWS